MLVTTDTNLRYQQNLAAREIAVVVLLTTSWPRIRASTALIVQAIDVATVAGYSDLRIP